MTTKHSPFEVLMGFLLKGHQVFRQSQTGSIMNCLDRISQLRQEVEINIKHAQELAIKASKFKPFLEGQAVWLDSKNLKTMHPITKLRPKRYGPFTVTKALSHVAYQLDLPPSWKIHNVFHATLLSPYKETEEHGRNFPEPPPDLIDGEEEWEVERIVDMRRFGRKKTLQYRVRWKGYSEAHDTWEPKENIHAPDLMSAFHQSLETPIQLRSIRTGPPETTSKMWSYRSPSNHSSSSGLSSPSSSPCPSPNLSPQSIEITLPAPSSSPPVVLDEGHDITDPPASYEELVALAEQADEQHTGEEREDQAVDFLASYLRRLTDPLTFWERFDNPVLDWETPSSRSCHPHSTYSFASPYTLPNLQLGIISPTQLRGYLAPHNPLAQRNPPAIKRQGVLIIRRIVEDDTWNRAILAVSQQVTRGMPPSSPHSSLPSSPTMEKDSPEYILSPEQIAALPDFFETALPDVIPTTPEEEGAIKGSLHPGEPWVRADAYSFDLLPLHA
jgi:hypothetical protein